MVLGTAGLAARFVELRDPARLQRGMKRWPARAVAAFLLPACATFAGAQHGTDPLKSAACGEALAALQAAREGGTPGSVETLRQQATQTCLGGGDAPARPSRAMQGPIAVPPPVIAPPGPAAAARVPQPLPPAVDVGRPPVITSCDLNGCWTSDGARLNRVGPQLNSPSGPCTVQGSLAYCP
jgi:hypothetical protein